MPKYLSHRDLPSRNKITQPQFSASLCMTQWADVSVSAQMTLIHLDERPIVETVSTNNVETKCPMYRTQTVANVSQQLERESERAVSQIVRNARRRKDPVQRCQAGDSVEILTIHIGNEHRLIRTDESLSNNRHDWKFFVRPSRTDIIEEVQIFLHPTFRNPRIIVQHFP